MWLGDVSEGMIFEDDVVSADIVLVARGQTLTANLLDRIRQPWAPLAGALRVRARSSILPE